METKALNIMNYLMKSARYIVAGTIFSACVSSQSLAGSYIFAGEGDEDWITHPSNYSPSVGGVVDINLCIVPGSTNANALIQSVENTANVWTQLKPTTENRVSGLSASGVNGLDVESVLIHEVGHCLGLGHPNMGSGYDQTDATKSLAGADGVFMIDGNNSSPNYSNGVDGLAGSADDTRGDDENLHWYRTSNNNPFTIANVVDYSQYSLDLADLPGTDSYVSNADRDVALNYGSANNSEAVMQQGTSYYEAQRQLGHDDVATILLGAIGVDRTVGGVDDYEINVISLGISDSADCDINIRMSGSSFAFCSVGGRYLANGHWGITRADIYLSEVRSDWIFNDTDNCSASYDLVDSQWSLISLPCATGISSADSDTVASVFGDDGLGVYGTDWVVYEWDGDTGTYTFVPLDTALVSHRGYWIVVIGSDATITVEGQKNAIYDIPLQGDPLGRFNLVGHGMTDSHDWADACIIDANGNLLTINDVDPDIGGGLRACDQDPVAASCRMSRIFHKWNGSVYSPYDGNTPGMEGSVDEYDGLWVKAYESGLSLRLPSSNACVTAANAAASSEVISGSVAETIQNSAEVLEIDTVSEEESTSSTTSLKKGEWFITLTAESDSGLVDTDNVFGVLHTAAKGYDQHDLKELTPFSASYLNLSFNQEDWGSYSGDYASDYRRARSKRRRTGGIWDFQVTTSQINEDITLTWNGKKSILRHSILIDTETGERIRPNRSGAYQFSMNGESVRKFTWRVRSSGYSRRAHINRRLFR